MMKKIFKLCAALALLFFFAVTITEQLAYARAGGGRSFGGRGSRSYSAPSRQSSQPTRDYSQPNAAQPGGGLLRGLGAGIAGGFLGSMLFRGLGYGSTGLGGGGGGIGLLEILVIGGLGFMLYRMYKKRKKGSGSPSLFGSGGLFGGYANNSTNRESDLSDIKMSDPSFDESRFKDNVMDMFFKIQAAWMNRDLSSAKSLLTDEMRNIFQEDIDAMLSSKKINRLENIAVRNVEISEAWQEAGQDYITTLIYANILDYTIDEQDSTVVNGSKTDPIKFEEYWTFTRPSRSDRWMLSAINQA
jgi:predicted lipid-binding transport protein (Tim44 family)